MKTLTSMPHKRYNRFRKWVVIVRLVRLKNNKKKMIYIVFSSFIMILVLLGLLLFQSYAVFTEEKHFNVINGTVSDPGDIYFAYYVDNEITREFPGVNSGYTLDIEKSNCTNGVSINFDDSNWQVNLNYKNYKAIDNTRTRCTLFFKKTFIRDLIVESLTNNDIFYDDYGNLRYMGSNPNNYILVDNDYWRIIGIEKIMDDQNNEQQLVKIIKDSSIGSYSWDTSVSSVNNGYGVNEWSQADLMKLLNPGYESESVGGSLYWNSKMGSCYTSISMGSTSCSFVESGMKENLKKMISKVYWPLGSNGQNSYDKTTNGLVKHFYTYERSDNTGKICSVSDYCTDTITRTTKWLGYVGLLYPSDYGYATSDKACLNDVMTSWGSSCYQQNWLHLDTGYQWTMTPSASDKYNHGIFVIHTSGMVLMFGTNGTIETRPVVYLKKNILLKQGDGSKANPYILSEK